MSEERIKAWKLTREACDKLSKEQIIMRLDNLMKPLDGEGGYLMEINEESSFWYLFKCLLKKL